MGSLLEELARRQAEARQRIEELGRQLAEVRTRLEAEQERLSRLLIASEVVEEILSGQRRAEVNGATFTLAYGRMEKSSRPVDRACQTTC
ncbi:MAG: hypothetical protein HOV86_20770 [Thermoactinospora sp.]|nr:hypothetical protein [Thermoactinospora sp.]